MSELVSNNIWVSGPSFLLNFSESFPNEDFNTDVELEVHNPEVVHVTNDQERSFQIERWGSFTKAIRVVSWCLIFINNLKLKKELRKMDDLSLLEMSVGKSVLISIDQKQNFPREYKTLAHGLILPKSSSLYKLTPFMDESGLLRIKGRLQCSDLTYEEKHPIIMACSHLSSLLIRFQHKLMKHSGVQTYPRCP